MSDISVLFYKVFHNKYLFNYIIEQIHSVEWVLYDNHKQLNSNNRFKFKDIHCLKFMLQRELYSLIINKINNDDYIKITINSIKLLFFIISNNGNNNNNNNNNTTNNNNNNTNQKEDLISILNLLLSKKRNEIDICDLPMIAIECDSSEILNILLSNSITVNQPSTLEHAINKKCNLEIIKLLDPNFKQEINKKQQQQQQQSSPTIDKQKDTKLNNLPSEWLKVEIKEPKVPQFYDELIEAIKSCDIKSLENWKSKDIKTLGSHSKIKYDFKLLPKNEKDILKLVQFLNKCKYDQFGLFTSSNFYELLLSTTNIPTDKIKLNAIEDSQQQSLNSRLPSLLKSTNSYKYVELLIQNIQIIELPTNYSRDTRDLYYENVIYTRNKQIPYKEIENIDSLISFLMVLSKRYFKISSGNNNGSNGSNGSNGINDCTLFLIQYHYKLLLRIKGIGIESILKVHKIFKENQIIIQHDKYHAFYYLLIRDIKFIKYILSKSNLILETSNRNYFHDRYFNSTINYLNHDQFKFEMVFGKSNEMYGNGNGNGEYINSFNCLFNKLIQQLSYDPHSDGKQDIECSDLEFILEIKQVDIFFEHLEKFKSISPNFNYSDNLLKLVCKVLNAEQLNRFIEFGFIDQHQQQKQLSIQKLYQYSSFYNKFELVSYLLDNYKSSINYFNIIGNFNCLSFIFNNYSNLINMDNLYKFKLTFELTEEELEIIDLDDFRDRRFYESSTWDNDCDDEDQYGNKLNNECRFNENGEKDYQDYQDDEDNNRINIFTQSFGKGDIKMCDLILIHYPNKFEINEYAITQSIDNNNIHIIKYYMDVIKNDNELLDHLKSELSYVSSNLTLNLD